MAKAIKTEEAQKHIITEQDIINNPELEGQVEIGEEVELGPEVEPEEIYGAKKHYEEWEVKIEGRKAKKLVISRKRVMITDEQAEILNQGVTEGGNTYAKMYFRAEK